MRTNLTILGGFKAQLSQGPPLRVPTRKAKGLLAYLALPCGIAHPRDKLAALLWGDMREGRARANLRQTLFTLRKALPVTLSDSLRLDTANLALEPAAVDVDVATFERLVTQGTPEALVQAAAVYQGDLLQGLAVREASFEEWLMAERERLRELALETLAKLLAQQRAAGATELALQTALRLLALDPLLETGHRTLMRLYAQLGRRDTALRQYQMCVGVLRRELGVEPEEETRRLYQNILRERLLPAPAAAKPDGWRSPSHAAILHLRPFTPATDTRLVGREPHVASLRGAMAEAEGGARSAGRDSGRDRHRKDSTRRRAGERSAPDRQSSRPARSMLRRRADAAVRPVGGSASERTCKRRPESASRRSAVAEGARAAPA